MEHDIDRCNQESSMKFHLAHLVPDRPSMATISPRRGISIFSPMQTLDQLGCEENPTRDFLDPTAASKAIGTSSSKAPPPPQSPPAKGAPTPLNSAAASVTYGECLKNHAASTGSYAVDGCREFMPSGEEGTQESVKCAACGCHRNFHRKGEPEPFHFLPLPTAVAPPRQQLRFATTFAPMPLNLVGNSGAAGSSSEYLDMFAGYSLAQPSSSGSKKRFRTKFTQEQRDRMHEFATKLGWSLQNEDDQEMRKFCLEVGVKRRVFKVWMHNNKKKQT